MVFPTFFKSEFGNKEIMIWPTVSSSSCFCSLYRASPSLAAKNIINLISMLAIWWCPCVESLVLLEEVFALTNVFSWQNSISLCPASFCIPRPNYPITPDVSWLSSSAFQSPMMKMRLVIFFAAKDREATYDQQKKIPGADCGSDHELLIANFRL